MIKDAESGNLDAQLSLGYIYLYGEGDIKPDYSKAFRYYEMAAAQNDNVAINNLGSLYYSGIGTPADVGKAMEMFDKAAAVNSDAQLYKQAGNGVTIPVVYAVGKRIVEIQNELNKEAMNL